MLTAAFILYAGATLLRVWMARSDRFVGQTAAERPTLSSLRSSLATMAAMLMAGGLVTWVLLVDGAADVAYSLSGEIMPLYLTQLGGLTVAQIGGLASLRGVFLMLATIPAGWLSDRWGERVGVTGGFLLQFLAFVVFLSATGLTGFTISAVLFAIGVGIMIPAFDSLISKAVPEKMRGVAFGLYGASIGLISLPAPWIGAQLWERFYPALPFAITAVALLGATVPAWTKLVLPDKPHDEASGSVGAGDTPDAQTIG